VEGVPQKTVTPPPEQLARIRREQALVDAAKAQPPIAPRPAAGVRWRGSSGLRCGPISGVYGSQRYLQRRWRATRITASMSPCPPERRCVRPPQGHVTLAEPDLYFSGGTVILDHGFRFSSSFLHMSKVLVSVGQEVQAGDVIGEVGATGRATGAHLDWRMNWRNQRVDPQLLAPPMPQSDPGSAPNTMPKP
jgi:hypothetical protein